MFLKKHDVLSFDKTWNIMMPTPIQSYIKQEYIINEYITYLEDIRNTYDDTNGINGIINEFRHTSATIHEINMFLNNQSKGKKRQVPLHVMGIETWIGLASEDTVNKMYLYI